MNLRSVPSDLQSRKNWVTRISHRIRQKRTVPSALYKDISVPESKHLQLASKRHAVERHPTPSQAARKRLLQYRDDTLEMRP